MQFERDEFRLLTEIGFSATARGMGEQARPIFDALALCLPHNAAAAIGYALIAIVAGDLANAITILERDGIKKRDNADGAKSVLVLALRMAGRDVEADRLTRELSRNAGPARSVASAMR